MAYTTINKPADYFNTVLYTGNASTKAVTGVGFQPDWTWIKNRSIVADHKEFDNVRGATKALIPNSGAAEFTQSGLDSFDSDGFTVGSHSGCNGNGNSLVAWNWLAANGTSANTDGSISSTVSANTTSGFSIVSYTGNATSGATVGHGLGSTPKAVFVKNRTDGSSNWMCYHSGVASDAETDYIELNTTAAASDYTGAWNDTAPTSSVFSIGNDNNVNGSGDSYVAYCFAEKKGFSKFGSFAGNGSNDGTFVYTGFKPAFVITKLSSGTGSWFLHDNKRNGFNGSNAYFYTDTGAAEMNTVQLEDFVSNGFKMRYSGGANSSGTSIYMAFAENPLVTSGGTPATAR